jgi:hypothetical protein
LQQVLFLSSSFRSRHSLNLRSHSRF